MHLLCIPVVAFLVTLWKGHESDRSAFCIKMCHLMSGPCWLNILMQSWHTLWSSWSGHTCSLCTVYCSRLSYTSQCPMHIYTIQCVYSCCICVCTAPVNYTYACTFSHFITPHWHTSPISFYICTTCVQLVVCAMAMHAGWCVKAELLHSHTANRSLLHMPCMKAVCTSIASLGYVYTLVRSPVGVHV